MHRRIRTRDDEGGDPGDAVDPVEDAAVLGLEAGPRHPDPDLEQRQRERRQPEDGVHSGALKDKGPRTDTKTREGQ